MEKCIFPLNLFIFIFYTLYCNLTLTTIPKIDQPPRNRVGAPYFISANVKNIGNVKSVYKLCRINILLKHTNTPTEPKLLVLPAFLRNSL